VRLLPQDISNHMPYLIVFILFFSGVRIFGQVPAYRISVHNQTTNSVQVTVSSVVTVCPSSIVTDIWTDSLPSGSVNMGSTNAPFSFSSTDGSRMEAFVNSAGCVFLQGKSDGEFFIFGFKTAMLVAVPMMFGYRVWRRWGSSTPPIVS
jgi:hypothetical protein